MNYNKISNHLWCKNYPNYITCIDNFDRTQIHCPYCKFKTILLKNREKCI